MLSFLEFCVPVLGGIAANGIFGNTLYDKHPVARITMLIIIATLTILGAVSIALVKREHNQIKRNILNKLS